MINQQNGYMTGIGLDVVKSKGVNFTIPAPKAFSRFGVRRVRITIAGENIKRLLSLFDLYLMYPLIQGYEPLLVSDIKTLVQMIFKQVLADKAWYYRLSPQLIDKWLNDVLSISLLLRLFYSLSHLSNESEATKAFLLKRLDLDNKEA